LLKIFAKLVEEFDIVCGRIDVEIWWCQILMPNIWELGVLREEEFNGTHSWQWIENYSKYSSTIAMLLKAYATIP
jgi:hypothetical protein